MKVQSTHALAFAVDAGMLAMFVDVGDPPMVFFTVLPTNNLPL